MGQNTFQKLEKMEVDLRQSPKIFFDCNAHQAESTMLEYKASFAYDKALDVCPYGSKNKKKPLNDALVIRILETIIAFANTKGGLLILGVGEKGSQVVNNQQKLVCSTLDTKAPSQKPCFLTIDDQQETDAGNLKIYGLGRELEVLEADFDQFQRRIMERLSLGSGKHQRKGMTFKPYPYPCDSKINSPEQLRITITPSKSPDLLIGDIFSISYPVDEGKSLQLGAIVVPPTEVPVTLRIEESNSQTVKYVLPVRKPGRTDLEEDLQRVLDFIQKRFNVGHVEEFITGVLNQFDKGDQKSEQITEDNLIEVVNTLAQEWADADYPYYLIEKYGEALKKFTLTNPVLDTIENQNSKAFLLMISIQFNAGWEKWTPRNLDNLIALQVVINSLAEVYWRTRFRTLYALQFFDQKQISEILADNCGSKLSEKTTNVLKTHCPKKTVVKFLKGVAASGQEPVNKKAMEVLLEIASRWKDKDAGEGVPL